MNAKNNSFIDARCMYIVLSASTARVLSEMSSDDIDGNISAHTAHEAPPEVTRDFVAYNNIINISEQWLAEGALCRKATIALCTSGWIHFC